MGVVSKEPTKLLLEGEDWQLETTSPRTSTRTSSCLTAAIDQARTVLILPIPGLKQAAKGVTRSMPVPRQGSQW